MKPEAQALCPKSGKVVYQTPLDAYRKPGGRSGKKTRQRTVYGCTFCGGWHIASSDGRQ